MFDLGKLTETIGGLFSGGAGPAELEGGLVQLLSNAGIDPALLDGLNQEEIMNLLSQHGIDPGTLDLSQISNLVQENGLGGNLAEVAQSWLDRARG